MTFIKAVLFAVGMIGSYFLLRNVTFEGRRRLAKKLQVVGFPEFWQKAHDVKPAAFEAMANVQLVSNALFSKPISEPLHKVIRQIARNTVNALGALTTLLLNGYGNDGMKIVRGMFENSVLAQYLVRHPELLDDYFDYYHIKIKRQLDYLDNNNPDLVTKLSATRRAEIESEYLRVKPKFIDFNGRLRRSWSKASIRDMAKDVGLEDHYLTIYNWAASMHHMDISGVILHADHSVIDIDADVAPSVRWIPEALISGHQATLIVLGEYNHVAQLGMDAEIEMLKQTFLQVWKI